MILYRKLTQNVTINKMEETVISLLKTHPNYNREQLENDTLKIVHTIKRVLNSLREKGLVRKEGVTRMGVGSLFEDLLYRIIFFK